MVAQRRGDDEPRGRLVDVKELARDNLDRVGEWATQIEEAINGEQAAEVLGDNLMHDPEVAAWHARSFGYDEGRADATEQIRQLQARITELEKHSLSERLFQIMLRLDERIGGIETAVARIAARGA